MADWLTSLDERGQQQIQIKNLLLGQIDPGARTSEQIATVGVGNGCRVEVFLFATTLLSGTTVADEGKMQPGLASLLDVLGTESIATGAFCATAAATLRTNIPELAVIAMDTSVVGVVIVMGWKPTGPVSGNLPGDG
jgi:hypothetical protein